MIYNKPRKTIVFIIDTMSRSGGTERFIQKSCSLLSENFKTYVITIDGGKGSHFKLSDSTTILSIPYFKKNRMMSRFPIANLISLFIKKKLRNIEGETILIPTTLRILEFTLKKLGDDYKIIACEHRTFNNASKTKEAKGIRKYANKAAAWMALTKTDKVKYESLHKNVFYIANYCPSQPSITEKKLSEERLKFVSVGNVIFDKGFHRSIDYLKNLKTKQEVEYHIYGDHLKDKKYTESLKRKVIEMPNLKLFLHGINTDLNEVYRDKDFYIMSSLNEAFGYVIIEAKSFGLPIISLDSPNSIGPREIVKNDFDGIVCTSQQDFNEFILKLQDTKIYTRYSKNALNDQRERFSKDSAIKCWLEMLDNI